MTAGKRLTFINLNNKGDRVQIPSVSLHTANYVCDENILLQVIYVIKEFR